MFTTEGRAFIRAILTNPAELTAWLIYADWLDEHDSPLQAEFLRLMARRGQLSDTEPEWYTVEERLQELRAVLEPVWVEVFDRPKVENCQISPAFRFQCPKQWENLKVTGAPAVRYCDVCHENVHYCHTLEEAQSHARQGRCVAVRLGVLRHPGDLDRTIEDAAHEMLMAMSEPTDELMGLIDPYYEPPPPPRPWWKFW